MFEKPFYTVVLRCDFLHKSELYFHSDICDSALDRHNVVYTRKPCLPVDVTKYPEIRPI